MADDRPRKKSNIKFELAMVCCGLLVIGAIVGTIVGVLEHYNPDAKLPAYTVSKAVLSSAVVSGGDQNLLTADFRFTLNVSNPNKKKTIFFDEDDEEGNYSQVNISCLVNTGSTSSSSSEEHVIDIASAALLNGGGPSSLGPKNSSDMTVNLRAQNVPLPPLKNNNNYLATTVVLTMSFRARFHKKRSNYKYVLVTCAHLNCTFPTPGFSPNYDPTCKTT